MPPGMGYGMGPGGPQMQGGGQGPGMEQMIMQLLRAGVPMQAIMAKIAPWMQAGNAAGQAGQEAGGPFAESVQDMLRSDMNQGPTQGARDPMEEKMLMSMMQRNASPWQAGPPGGGPQQMMTSPPVNPMIARMQAHAPQMPPQGMQMPQGPQGMPPQGPIVSGDYSGQGGAGHSGVYGAQPQGPQQPQATEEDVAQEKNRTGMMEQKAKQQKILQDVQQREIQRNATPNAPWSGNTATPKNTGSSVSRGDALRRRTTGRKAGQTKRRYNEYRGA